jgi:5-dehydro-2-deoxygluconokinase
MDLYPAPDGTRIEDAATFVADVGGAGGNIAVALARQGARVALVTAFSDDAVGRFVRTRLEGFGVDTTLCRAVGGERRTSLALAETRAADGAVVIYRNDAADFDLPDFDAALAAEAATLVVTGTALAAEPSRSRTFAAIAAARRAKTFVILDIDHRPYSWRTTGDAVAAYTAAARASDAAIGNIEEFALLGGRDSDPHVTAEALVGTGCAFVIVKNGAKGAAVYRRAGGFETPAFEVAAKKPFGAGDAFLGSLVAALARGIELPGAVEWGAAAAAIVVSRRGCASAMPTREESGEFMAARVTAG